MVLALVSASLCVVAPSAQALSLVSGPALKGVRLGADYGAIRLTNPTGHDWRPMTRFEVSGRLPALIQVGGFLQLTGRSFFLTDAEIGGGGLARVNVPLVAAPITLFAEGTGGRMRLPLPSGGADRAWTVSGGAGVAMTQGIATLRLAADHQWALPRNRTSVLGRRSWILRLGVAFSL